MRIMLTGHDGHNGDGPTGCIGMQGELCRAWGWYKEKAGERSTHNKSLGTATAATTGIINDDVGRPTLFK